MGSQLRMQQYLKGPSTLELVLIAGCLVRKAYEMRICQRLFIQHFQITGLNHTIPLPLPSFQP